MSQTIVVLSGPVACGKTTLGESLCLRHGGYRFSTHELISDEFGADATPDRAALQALGEQLDMQSDGRWVADALGRRLTEVPEDALVVVDSARIQGQIDGLRAAYGRRVVHIHLTAPLGELARRYKRRPRKFIEMSSYDEVRQDPTEAKVELLDHDADIVINTFHCSSADVEVRAASHLRLRGRDWGELVDVIVGGEYGSEGKGNVASYIAPEYQLLVRIGGPNAGHKVYTASGEEFAHRLLPSGTLATDAPLLIGPGAVLDVDTLTDEIARCNAVAPESVDAERLSIDPKAMIISSADVRAEKDLKAAIGSTGKGVGAATARRITGRVRGPNGVRMAQQVEELKPYIREASEVLDVAFARGHRILLEGTQGSALSLYHGAYPYVTSRDTTVSGCLAEAGIPPSRVRKIVMVCRSFPIRVENPPGGSSGPMSQPISWAEVARRSHLRAADLRKHERGTVSGNLRRVAEFDWVLLQNSARLNGPTDIALTFADYIDSENQHARRFEQLTERTIQFIEEIERVAAAPVSLISTRFHTRSIIDRRSW
jgi:adenylosuccinate synthase